MSRRVAHEHADLLSAASCWASPLWFLRCCGCGEEHAKKGDDDQENENSTAWHQCASALGSTLPPAQSRGNPGSLTRRGRRSAGSWPRLWASGIPTAPPTA